MFWRILTALGALTFLAGGVTVLTTDNCDGVDFGGNRRAATYSCTTEGEGDASKPVAGGGMLAVGGLLLTVAAWPLIRAMTGGGRRLAAPTSRASSIGSFRSNTTDQPNFIGGTPAVAQPKVEPTRVGSPDFSRSDLLVDIWRDAQSDPGAKELVEALGMLERSCKVRRADRVEHWCFADGTVLLRRDGVLYAASPTGWSVVPILGVVFDVSASGAIARASIGSWEFTNLRPTLNARSLLKRIGGTERLVVPTVAESAVKSEEPSLAADGQDVSFETLATTAFDQDAPVPSEARYSTLDWTTTQVRDVRAALSDRGIEFQVQRGWVLVDPADQIFVDRIIGEHISAFSNGST